MVSAVMLLLSLSEQRVVVVEDVDVVSRRRAESVEEWKTNRWRRDG